MSLDLNWNIMKHRDEMKERKLAIDYCGGWSASRPHPFWTATGMEGFCGTCGGHRDRRIHDKPWERLVFGPCPNCASLPNAECDVCGDTRQSIEPTGVEYVR